MPINEVPRAEWREFFDAFSRQHDGWLVTLEVLDRESGLATEARDLPFRGVSTDAAREGEAVSILMGSGARDHVEHRVAWPTRVRLHQTPDGADEALHIEGREGSSALVRFRSPVRPEIVDGLAPAEAPTGQA